MTYTRYLLERIARLMGIRRTAQRLGDAASEMHLLREAEAHLGSLIWEKTENIDALSLEYWNLRKLNREYTALQERLVVQEAKLHKAQEERERLLNNPDNSTEALEAERAKLIGDQESLVKQRNVLIRDAKETRRSYAGLKLKYEVLVAETNHAPEVLHQLHQQLMELKQHYGELKASREAIVHKIAEGDAEIDGITAKIRERINHREQLAATAFQFISDCNKDVWNLRAEISAIDTRMVQHHAEIGQYVSRHAAHDAACATACAEQQGLVDVMRALRRSIALNHRLSAIA